MKQFKPQEYSSSEDEKKGDVDDSKEEQDSDFEDSLSEETFLDDEEELEKENQRDKRTQDFIDYYDNNPAFRIRVKQKPILRRLYNKYHADALLRQQVNRQGPPATVLEDIRQQELFNLKKAKIEAELYREKQERDKKKKIK